MTNDSLLSTYFKDGFTDEHGNAKWGSVATVAGAGAIGLLAGDWIGGVVGLAAGAALGPLVNGLISGNNADKWPNSGVSYKPPVVPGPEANLTIRGITINGDPKLAPGFTLKPNLEKIKKLEFDVTKLLEQTDMAERIKDKDHKKNAFFDLDTKYKGLFQFEVNFNEYVRLAKEYNEKDRPNLVAQYKALQEEKARLEGTTYTGNADAEAPKLFTPDADTLLRREALPKQYIRDMKKARDFVANPGYLPSDYDLAAIIPKWEQRYAQPYAIKTDKKILDSTWQFKDINARLFDGGSKGETLFLNDPSDYTTERDHNKLREMWKNMSLVQKIQVTEKGLTKEFDAKCETFNLDLLGQTNGWNEFKKGVGSAICEVGDGVVGIFSSKKPNTQSTLGSDSANAAASLKQTLEQNRPSRMQMEGTINFAIANPANETVKAEWIKLRDMLPLIEERNMSRRAMQELMSMDINPKQIYIEQKIKPQVAQIEQFEKKVFDLEAEVKKLRASKPVTQVGGTRYTHGAPTKNTNPSAEQKAKNVGGADMMQVSAPGINYPGTITLCGAYNEATGIFTLTGYELRPSTSVVTKGGHYFACNGQLNLKNGDGFEVLFKAIEAEARKPENHAPVAMGTTGTERSFAVINQSDDTMGNLVPSLPGILGAVGRPFLTSLANTSMAA